MIPALPGMGGPIFEWEGLGESDAKVIRLHGRHDLVIPPPERVDLLVEGGHLISITHAGQCADFIRSREQLRETTAVGGAQP